eukprot:m.9645 g.9645  ORF g.9645 m.9645 type:complete len:214 (+) comp4104_c0_seq1:241-882(+)
MATKGFSARDQHILFNLVQKGTTPVKDWETLCGNLKLLSVDSEAIPLYTAENCARVFAETFKTASITKIPVKPTTRGVRSSSQGQPESDSPSTLAGKQVAKRYHDELAKSIRKDETEFKRLRTKLTEIETNPPPEAQLKTMISEWNSQLETLGKYISAATALDNAVKQVKKSRSLVKPAQTHKPAVKQTLDNEKEAQNEKHKEKEKEKEAKCC